MEIGKFSLSVDGSQNLTGLLLGFPHELEFQFQQDGGKTTATGKTLPTYKVFVHGTKTQVGAAWVKSAKKTGLNYYETTFDNLGPLFPQKIYANLVPSMIAGEGCSLLWDSPKEKADYAAKRPAAALTPSVA
jgi:uncharacterized protein (DUF736 family)